MATVEERVASGAYMLDIFSPGWREKIDLARLDIRSCTSCVLGQVFGDYECGMKALGLWYRSEGITHKTPMVSSSMLGFGIHQNDPINKIVYNFEELLDAWIAEVTA